MVDSRLKTLYDHSPRFLQNLAVSAKGWQLKRRRYGGEFEELLKQAKERQRFSQDQLRSYRRQRLSEFLQTAADSPFWQEQFEAHDVSPVSKEPFNELEKLPILKKDDIKNSGLRVRPDRIPTDDLLSCHTSGTTGGGLTFSQTKRALREKWAIWWRHRQWHNIQRGTWQGRLTGIPIVPLENSGPPFWRVDYPNRQVRYSTFHLKPETVEAYANSIRKREISWLHGYPSALALLGNLMLDQGLPPISSVEIVTIGAEKLFNHQRETIETAFDAPVTYHYGLAESVANISHCPQDNLHVDEDFAHVEFIPHEEIDGYRIVGTNWSNPAFPLLRYDTGDIARLADGTCSCGRPGRIVESIEGRRDDYVILPNGSRVGRLDHIFKDFESIREAQIYQPDRNQIVLKIVPGEEYDTGTETDLLNKARSRLGTEIDIAVEQVTEIKRTDSGKLKFVVSDVDDMQIETPTV